MTNIFAGLSPGIIKIGNSHLDSEIGGCIVIE